ncbi:hypothetical protein [Streptomyces sp. NPDC052610]|uniref:hypothetical protein n=1 Tax=Streptomyces sp. NPDC052610 TaxID=3154952 RepID=UPI003437BB30
MSGHDNDEPVFLRERGTRFVYNPRNPIGLALIVLTVVGVIAYMYHLHDSSQWSEDEFRDAVREAEQRLEAEPQRILGFSIGYEDLIQEAVEEADDAPEIPLVSVEEIDSTTFEAGTKDVDTSYCLTVSPPQPEPELMLDATVTLTVDVREGPC